MAKYSFKIKGNSYEVEVQSITGPMATVVVNGKPYKVNIEDHGQAGSGQAQSSAKNLPPQIIKRATVPVLPHPASAPGTLENVISTPMPGVVVKIAVQVGQAVKAGETVVIFESMKMENNIVAPKTCVIKQILVKEGQDVAEQVALMEYEERA